MIATGNNRSSNSPRPTRSGLVGPYRRSGSRDGSRPAAGMRRTDPWGILSMMSTAEARSTTSLARHLMCAVPQLLDPNFRRAVVLMLEHSEAGAMGLVLNNASSTHVAEVAEALEMNWRGDPEQPVRTGGPVDPIRGWILHDQAGWDPAAETILPGVHLTSSLESAQEAGHRAFGEPGTQFQFLLGYAQWGAGQLEAEIASGAWVVVPLVGDDEPSPGVGPQWILHTHTHDMWHLALRSIGVDPDRLVGLHSRGAVLQ
ncbi:MAG: YqgE/AlgH family protein [Myxococcales bacterium FL481]|nr:MAG: YqgE/AlgH family protein [Myxococcales bacterium FL481]